MEQSLSECLNVKHGSYILPFLWLHGEAKERIKEEILAIRASGIYEFCAESRVHTEFCRDKWWDDFRYILEVARELGMRVWLLDDKSFPTGYANGYLESPERAHLRKRLIREKQTDVVGPMRGARNWVKGWLENEGEEIISVIAYPHVDGGEGLDYERAIDLTDKVTDGMAYWDIPKGLWRVTVTISTSFEPCDDKRMPYYIDMLNPDSCRAMLEAIYEPHYEHFKEYFGNTFAGFFSDEPGFLNRVYTYQNKTGIMYERYPWRNDLPRLIAESSGMSEGEVRLAIPALWEDLGDVTAAIRMHYMEVLTKLYRENFSNMLGDWCRERGVMYIGHVIEDMGTHMRLGYGSGHYFRALDGQDMAGIDIVLMQDIPGLSTCVHRAFSADRGYTEPSFFRYTLPKLAASHSHIQPRKKGRAMCEIFGAFGWAEGLPFMKGLADIMLGSGINYFVPHAFSPKEEDEDCPPHFYNGGKNIQFPLFKRLMEYMGRCAHMTSGGVHQADVAVFYNAEGEWTGGKNQTFHTLCMSLTRGLVDFDIVPHDVLAESCVGGNSIMVNGESYGALIVSSSEIMPRDRLEVFDRLAKCGLPVIFTDSLPCRVAEGGDASPLCDSFKVVNMDNLAPYLHTSGLCQLSAEGQGAADLRFYHVNRGGTSVYLFSNEAIRDTFDGYITLPESGECAVYDPWDNKLYRSSVENGKLPLTLEKGNLLFVIFGVEIPKDAPLFRREVERIALPLDFDISLRGEGEADFSLISKSSSLFDVTSKPEYSRFSGEVLYEAKFEAPSGYTVLDLGEVGETAEVWINGKYLGARINAPYKFDLSTALSHGENSLRVLVRSSLAHKRRDWFSCFMQISPTGILGDVALCKYE